VDAAGSPADEVGMTGWRGEHCLHINPGEGARYCCWCQLTQHRVQDKDNPKHGSRFLGEERYEWHWEPSSQDACPRDADEERETA
jgi:hypothetical protein